MVTKNQPCTPSDTSLTPPILIFLITLIHPPSLNSFPLTPSPLRGGLWERQPSQTWKFPRVYLILWRLLGKSNKKLCLWWHGTSVIQISLNFWPHHHPMRRPPLLESCPAAPHCLSSTESEIMVTNECVKYTISLRHQAADLDIIDIASPTVV